MSSASINGKTMDRIISYPTAIFFILFASGKFSFSNFVTDTSLMILPDIAARKHQVHSWFSALEDILFLALDTGLPRISKENLEYPLL